MAETTIGDLPAAAGIDGTNDYLIIQTNSPSATNKINRTTFLGVAAQPVDISTSQTLTNKVIGNTNTITVKDSLFTLQDNLDTTKQAQFQLSGITTATTRTYTLPNASVTLASLTGTETLTNKTITSPAITGGTIDNSTITVDSISGHTTSTIVTVGGVQLNNGTIGTSSAVTAASIATSAVTPEKLLSGAGTGWAWQAFTPSFTNVTVGNGTVIAKYVQIGKTIIGRVGFVLGSSSSVSGSVSFTLPSPANTDYANNYPIGQLYIEDTGVTGYMGYIQAVGSPTVIASLFAMNASATYVTVSGSPVNATTPFTFAAGDNFKGEFYYEIA